jgi:hypothetical protein
LLSRHASIKGDNVVANNTGQASIALTQGGIYNFRHCTFANYSTYFGQSPVIINDYQETPDAVFVSDLTANFDNCILYGSSNFALSLEKVAGDDVLFKCKFNNCLIKLADFSNILKNNPLYPFDGNNPELVTYTPGCIIAKNSIQDKPDFLDPVNNKLNLGDAEGGANGSADPAISALVPNDILGNVRSGLPDMGAYESVVFPED